MMSLT